MEQELRELGLENYESKALSVLLSEKANLRQLSDKAKIPFGKIYSVVKSLKEKGLVKETNSRPKLIYVDNASEVISRLIEEKNEKERLISARLKRLASEIDLSKGKETKFFQIGTSNEDNKKIQLRTFREAKEEVLQILNIHHKPKSNRESKTLWEKEILEAVKRGITFKSIYPMNAEIPSILKTLNKKQPDKFQIRKIDTDFVRCDIIDHEKVMIKLVQQDPLQFGGILFIENEGLNNNLRKIFNELWEHASR